MAITKSFGNRVPILAWRTVTMKRMKVVTTEIRDRITAST
jgi:hypothetical protein